MQTTIQYQNETYQIRLDQAMDISIPLQEGLQTVNAFYAPPLQIEPVRAGDFVGDVRQGGVVNFKNVLLNPHGNGTHTECVGHISPNGETINRALKQFFFLAELISVYPQKMENGDRVVLKEQIVTALAGKKMPQALVIRTLPNDDFKLRTHYSGANPPYLHHEATQYIVENGVEHLLLDLPSVDREEDGGELLSHKVFWQYPHDARLNATITEMIYVPNGVKDGKYFLNLQITSLEMDASPSKPVLFKVFDGV
ncbi:MAG: cyclase family protein [Chitinophagales bacterium]